MLSQYDQSVYDAGYKYIPQSKYLLNPFQVPTGSENEVPTGIATTYQAQAGGGGGGGMGYAGGITGLTTDFQKAVDARTQRLEDAYNNPSTAKLFGLNMFKQDVNPADAGFYVGECMRIPQERTVLGKMFQPQSPQEIMEQGYEPRTNIGILSNILGKADKFGTLPRADQAFITSQMGYTGPTVFGENTSGLSKDPFGLNTRSAFGNYAERVGKEVTSLEEALAKARGKYDTEEDFLNATKLMRTKLNFYREKVKERDALRAQEEADKQAAIDAAAAESRRRSQILYDREQHGGTNYGLGGDNQQSYSGDALGDKDQGFGIGATTGGPVSNRTGRGRTDYMDGGLADLVDIYD